MYSSINLKRKTIRPREQSANLLNACVAASIASFSLGFPGGAVVIERDPTPQQ